MIDDPIVAEVRAIRAKMLSDCGGDLDKLIASIHRNTRKLGLKTVSFVNRRSAKVPGDAAELGYPFKARKREAV